MDVRPQLREGEYARINDRVGIIRDTDDISHGSRCRYVLHSLPGRPPFDEIQINNNNWPFDALSPEAMINIMIGFTFRATQVGVVLQSSQEAPPARTSVYPPNLCQTFILSDGAFIVFEGVMRQLEIEQASEHRDIIFYRLFGVEYDDARRQFDAGPRF